VWKFLHLDLCHCKSKDTFFSLDILKKRLHIILFEWNYNVVLVKKKLQLSAIPQLSIKWIIKSSTSKERHKNGLSNDFSEERKFSEERLSSAAVPECLASLHVVKFEEVNGNDHDLFLAKFFMKNCMILERMCFSFAEIMDKDEVMEEFKEKYYSFHSDSVAVKFKEN